MKSSDGSQGSLSNRMQINNMNGEYNVDMGQERQFLWNATLLVDISKLQGIIINSFLNYNNNPAPCLARKYSISNLDLYILN